MIQSKPVAQCTTCGYPSDNISQINLHCVNSFKGKRCKGIYRSMLQEDDRKKCSNCNGSGEIKNTQCNTCKGCGRENIRRYS